MDTPDNDLARSLRRLAVVLGEALEDGAHHAALARRLSSATSDPEQLELVEDVLLAAGQLLAGADPHLPLLIATWGADDLLRTAQRLTRELPGAI